jgi:hypothetical protein
VISARNNWRSTRRPGLYFRMLKAFNIRGSTTSWTFSTRGFWASAAVRPPAPPPPRPPLSPRPPAGGAFQERPSGSWATRGVGGGGGEVQLAPEHIASDVSVCVVSNAVLKAEVALKPSLWCVWGEFPILQKSWMHALPLAVSPGTLRLACGSSVPSASNRSTRRRTSWRWLARTHFVNRAFGRRLGMDSSLPRRALFAERR